MAHLNGTVRSITASVFSVLLAASAVKANEADANHIIALERAALDRWGKGDPQGYLALYAPDITYFDPTDRRVDGIDAMRKVLEAITGKIKILHYQMLDPKVQQRGGVAVLTYRFVSEGSEGQRRWNNTEVYARIGGKWRIFHSHWSLTATQPARQGR